MGLQQKLFKEDMKMKFTKMQGLGNDYVYVNCFQEKIENPLKKVLRTATEEDIKTMKEYRKKEPEELKIKGINC